MSIILKILSFVGRETKSSDDYLDGRTPDLLDVQHESEQLASIISRLVIDASELLLNRTPYPPTVFSSVDNMKELQSQIAKKRNTGSPAIFRVYTKLSQTQ